MTKIFPKSENSPTNHHFFCGRVFLEDTDALGIVYYAKYLHFAERARNEWLRNIGFPHLQLLNQHQCAFVVRKCKIRYLRTLAFDDCFLVSSSLQSVTNFTLTLAQNVYGTNHCDLDKLTANLPQSSNKITSLQVELACIHQTSQNPQKPPPELVHRLLESNKDGTR